MEEPLRYEAITGLSSGQLVAERVDDECRIAGFLEQLPEPVTAVHLRSALYRVRRRLGRDRIDLAAWLVEPLPEEPLAGR
jgi:hypothetical protein